MKFSAATLLACAAMANAVAIPQSVTVTRAEGDVNAVVDPSVESHFSGVFDKATGLLVAKPDNENDPSLQKRDDSASISSYIQKRIAPVVVVIGIAAIHGAGILVKIAIEIGADTIKDLGQWNKAREEFTETTTKQMWARNPDYKKFPAAICYNKAYSLKNPSGIDGKVSAKLELGQLFTNYDCMYMTGNNQFYTKSDNGYINLSYTYNSARCSYDGKTGDLTCR